MVDPHRHGSLAKRVLLGAWSSGVVGFMAGAFIAGSTGSFCRRIPEFLLRTLWHQPTIAHFEYWVPILTLLAAAGGAVMGLLLGLLPFRWSRSWAAALSGPAMVAAFFLAITYLAAHNREQGQFFHLGKLAAWLAVALVAASLLGLFLHLLAQLLRLYGEGPRLHRTILLGLLSIVILFRGLRALQWKIARQVRATSASVEVVGQNRVLLIGLDGATWEIIDRLMEEGRMPVLRGLIDSGVRADLISQSPIESPHIWTTVATGKYPGEHGISFFVTKLPTSNQTIPAASTLRTASALWNIFTDYGRSSGIVGYYVSWPAEPVLGYVVSDRAHLDGADSLPGATYPTELFYEEIAGLDLADEHLLYRDAFYGNLGARLAETRPTDFQAVYLRGIDNLQHLYWNQIHPEEFREEAHVLPAADRTDIVDAYIACDRMIGGILEKHGDRTTVFVISDHGFESVAWIKSFKYEMNRLYAALGWLGYEGETEEIDWSATVFYDAGNRPGDRQRYASLNRVGREQEGIVTDQEYPALREEIVTRLRSLENENGKRIFEWVRPLSGDRFGDLRLRIDPRAIVGGRSIVIDGRTVPISDFASFFEGSGRHNRVGILIASGAHTRKGVEAYRYGLARRIGLCRKASVLDMGPTILYAMGLPVAQDMAGDVLTGLFEPAYLKDHPIRYVDSYERERESVPIDLSASNVDDQIKEQLRALGYIR